MNKKSLLNSGWLSLLFWLIIPVRTDALAQIRFVQITDVHMFDEEQEASENRAALAACVRQVNEEMAKGSVYKFAVVTGDIGVENLVSVIKETDGKRTRVLESRERRDESIRKGAAELASLMAPSRLKVWLFVPGNNDLYNEEITSLTFYEQFIDELRKRVSPWGIEVKDLCRFESLQVGSAESQPVPHCEGPYAFVGFNNASFKNNNDAARVVPGIKGIAANSPGIVSLDADEVRTEQESYVRRVLAQTGKFGAYVYVLYHIPEIDDPYLVSGKREQRLLDTLGVRVRNSQYIGKGNEYSAWFVATSVRELWNQVVKSDKVKGLFAGHFHSKDREVYQSYHWMFSTEYMSGSLSKLYVCPPLAIKLQVGEKVQARGFQEVFINSEGRVLDESGQPGVHILWYDPATGTFSPNASNKADDEARRQLSLGDLLERNGRLKDAEAAYTKALEGESSQLLNRSLDSVRRVVEKQISPLNRYIFTRWGLSLTPEGTYLFLAASLLLILVWFWRILGRLLLERKVDSLRLFRDFCLILFGPIGFTLPVLWVAQQENFYLPVVIVVALTAVALLVLLWFSWLVFKRARGLAAKRGRNKLIIVSRADSTNGKLGLSLPSVFAATREEIVNSRRFERVLSAKPTLPVVILAEDTEIADLVETTVPGRWGALLAWLLRRTTDPEYRVRTSVQSAGGNTTIIMSLEASAGAVRVWSNTFPDSLLHKGQRSLAYQVLVCVLRHSNYGVNYGDAS
jgi:3',5'-cyclic AMP phosphodiesterase CpdA